ncbi:MAG TPA: CRISPR-associated helicase Cas3' [Ktedonobacterales bacterium]|nr:CRISPR-associated helicase Cas3' [Ktedonobacterales bacterium]
MAIPAIAHTKNLQGVRQGLVDHLTQVATLAADFADAFQARDLGRLAGLLHDIGKFNPAFQQYLFDAEANPNVHHRGPDHKGAGAVDAVTLRCEPLAFLIAGHHGGLPSSADLKTNLLPTWKAAPAVPAAIAAACRSLPTLDPAIPQPAIPDIRDPYAAEMFLRMLFSALVDADFLDTERHFSGTMATRRTGAPGLDVLWERFGVYQAATSGRHGDRVNQARHLVYQRCLSAAELAPGFFRLTVPTGGGKTLSSLGFALAHARRYGMHRVIYAIPYTSIIEQTADVFRRVLADDRAVLEHHSAVAAPSDPDNPTPQEVWRRLAAENWDAPLVVTTTVQVFESLLARSTSACRKLHNLARSVIILDEAQMLPTHLLETTLDVLRQLVARYGATVVICTATQPALDENPAFKGLPQVREIVLEAAELFAQLKRVDYEWPQPGEQWTWEQAAEAMRESAQVLAVVNTRADAAALLEALDDPNALHLSTRMCGAHRRAVLEQVRERLVNGKPCRLVATQLIEAGVDVDFPLVLRALGPLDRIVQAAGRCNREGKLASGLGRVRIFVPEGLHLPPGSYRTGTELTAGALAKQADLHDPTVYTSYFQELYRHVPLDEKHVQDVRKILDYPAVAERFRMIEEDTKPVVVRYGEANQRKKIEDTVAQLRGGRGRAREHLRALQPYIVGLRERELQQAIPTGQAEEVVPGLWEWRGKYDTERGTGIVLDGVIDPELNMW